jgi:hypothetical protein
VIITGRRPDLIEHRFTFTLLLVTVEDPTAHLPHELLAELVGHPLRVRKDERAAAHLERAQDLVEDPKLLARAAHNV